MEVAGLIPLGFIAFFGASALIGRARITVFEYERGLWCRNGRFRRVLGPASTGTFRHLSAFKKSMCA
jgi:hypothetical protein